MPPLSGQHTEALTEVYADPDVARHIGGATLDADGTATQVVRFEAVWREHGFGQSALLDRATGGFLGRAGRWSPGWASASTARTSARQCSGRTSRPIAR